MHFILCILVIYLVWNREVWKDWKRYHTTMLFFSFMELYYCLIAGTNNYYLWRIEPDLFLTRVTVVSLYIFVIFPLTSLLFLSNYPDKIKHQAIYISKWIFVYIFVEWLASISDRINYYNGWKLWHSFIFNIILFWGLQFHHKKPLVAYILFILVTCLGIWMYKIPI